jgi:putative membrane protein
MPLPPWEPRPDIWLLVATLTGLYVWALRRVGPRHVAPGDRVANRGQMWAFGLAMFTLWVALDWPIDALGDHYLFSVHMFQHTLLMLVIPPLALYGLPAWLLRVLLRPRPVYAVARRLTRPFVALVLFNGIIVLTHWPAWVNLTLRSEPFHFFSHALLVGSALCMWWPVLSPLPEMPTLSYPARMLYLFLQSIVPTVPASFLTFGSTPLYRYYTTVPRWWGLSVITDQRIAGLEMKLIGGAILFTMIGVVFFKWYAEERKTEGWDAVEWTRTERELRPPIGRPSEAHR